MTKIQLSKYISALLLSSVLAVGAHATTLAGDSVSVDSVANIAPTDTVQIDTAVTKKGKFVIQRDSVKSHAFIRGFALYVELAGLGAKVFGGDNVYYEAGLRINLKQTYFPTVEVGYADSNVENDVSLISYKAKAPYFRVGMDYNFLKNKESNNRLFGGLRVGYTTFDYTIADPNFTDPVWNKPVEYLYTFNTSAIWTEFIFGLEAEVWKAFHLGWTVRYKVRWSQKESETSEPYYIPGFGTNDKTRLGATFYMALDI
jgi:hypothetical protein